jgi:hypothetical protein
MWLVVLVVLLPVCKDFFVNHHTTCRSSSSISLALFAAWMTYVKE